MRTAEITNRYGLGGGMAQRLWLPRVGGWALLLMPGYIVLVATLLLPLGYLVAMSFNPPSTGAVTLTSELTVRNYAKFFGDGYYWWILTRTVWMSLLTTAICVVLGFLTAHFLWRCPPRHRSLLTVIVLAPLLVSIVARTYGWMVILGDSGLLNNLFIRFGIIDEPVRMMFTQGAVVIGLVHVFLPFMVLSILAVLERIDDSLADAAMTLGASPLGAVRHVLLPLSLPGIAAGVTIVFSLSMSAYVTPALMGGSNANVLTTLIYQQFVIVYSWHFGSVLVVALLATSLMIIALILFQIGQRTRTWSART